MPPRSPHLTEVARSRSARRPRHHPALNPGDFTVVGIGASAGGLEACRKLLSALPAGNGMAFVLVQHLDPTHESLMAELLAASTPMTVLQATDGMPVEPDHLYVIPPGTYLAAGGGCLHLSPPQAPHGSRLPFDFLLHSLAESYGARAVAVVLSGTGADGSLGLQSVKKEGGLVIAQDPDEAAFNGMPDNAIQTGAVDLVLPIAAIPGALVEHNRQSAQTQSAQTQSAQTTTAAGETPPNRAKDCLPRIIELLRANTAHDFSLYKEGTLRRRIERRMAMAAVATDDMEHYLDVLNHDPDEIHLLAKELLINVTSFFRDQKVFDLLAQKIVPDLVARSTPDQPLRIWIAGCSTGEETYSFGMLFQEEIARTRPNLKLQIFASDVDPDAIAIAREGFYPATIAADLSPARLSRFFIHESEGYRVLPELRAAVIFAVQDVLSDPPFSRLDLVSCRNLLIYLLPEAQAKLISLFHFALSENGILVLGTAETAGNASGRFDTISEPERIYRRIGRSRLGEFGSLMRTTDVARPRPRPDQGPAPSRQAALAARCQRLVLDHYAPAAVLINRKHECLFSLGPTERYLRVAPGHPTHDLLALAHPGLRTRLRAAIQQAIQDNDRVVTAAALLSWKGQTLSFTIDVRPVSAEGEELLLVCFVEAPKHPEPAKGLPVLPEEVTRVVELEQELQTTRTELQNAIRNLETSVEEQKALNEEALSVNEEFQSANEELLTSKEELQSLNEELVALNGQLQESLERQRTTANDLQNILYSTDVATLFLDSALNIRFFTPATRLLFNLIPSDVGRPLADLYSLAADTALLNDARTVLQTLTPIEHEIEARTGAWYLRRILPYRTKDNHVEGVIITFVDVTERKRSADALEAAKRQAEQASLGKSRFLAAASHDLRQPLQTLALLKGLLAKAVEGEKARQLLKRFGKTLEMITGILNTLLDINQIETGLVHAEAVDFPIDDLLERLRDEFTPSAQLRGLTLRVVPCRQLVHSDPRLLKQIVSNLLSNALKYTRQGKVLLGCRRHGDRLLIEVCDTGVGIPPGELEAIFEEYYQLDNPARERSRGLGLGLAIVKRLAVLLGHRITVRSRPGIGSIFAVEVLRSPPGAVATIAAEQPEAAAEEATHPVGLLPRTILVIEDDPEVSDILDILLKEEGHIPATASDGIAALDLVARGACRPDLILADYNLPKGMNGLEVVAKLRQRLHRDVPVIVLTGDISVETLHNITIPDCMVLHKPVRLAELTRTIRHLLPGPSAASL